jgi:putative transposase
LTTKELDRVRVSIERGRPYGEEKWVRETVKDLGLEQTVGRDGRPRKASQSVTEATN